MKAPTTTQTPTPRAEWAKEGDRVYSFAGWIGTVLRVVQTHSIPYARVRWDENGSIGKHTITTLRRVK